MLSVSLHFSNLQYSLSTRSSKNQYRARTQLCYIAVQGFPSRSLRHQAPSLIFRMLSNILLILSTTSILSQAILVPAGTPNGIYVHNVDDDGSSKMEHIAPLLERSDSVPTVRNSAKFRRVALPGGTSGCTTTLLDSLDLAEAQYSLMTYCQGNNNEGSADVPSKKHVTSVSNGSVAYVCNYGKKNHCIPSEAQAAFAMLGGDCGSVDAPLGGW